MSEASARRPVFVFLHSNFEEPWRTMYRYADSNELKRSQPKVSQKKPEKPMQAYMPSTLT